MINYADKRERMGEYQHDHSEPGRSTARCSDGSEERESRRETVAAGASKCADYDETDLRTGPLMS